VLVKALGEIRCTHPPAPDPLPGPRGPTKRWMLLLVTPAFAATTNAYAWQLGEQTWCN